MALVSLLQQIEKLWGEREGGDLKARRDTARMTTKCCGVDVAMPSDGKKT